MKQYQKRPKPNALFIGVCVVLAAVGVQAAALADMHIIIENHAVISGMHMGDSMTQHLYFKDDRIVMPQGDGTHILIHCAVGEFSFVAPDAGVYWRGSAEDFLGEFRAAMNEMSQLDPNLDFSWLDDMFGPEKDNHPMAVRTTPIGTDTVAGYDAVQYRVEHEQNGTWRHYEDIWLAAGILDEMGAEGAHCLNTVSREIQQMMVGLSTGEMTESYMVFTSPEYNTLIETGFPIRSETITTQFGITVVSHTKVISVSDAPLAETMFVVPEDFEKISVLEMIM